MTIDLGDEGPVPPVEKKKVNKFQDEVRQIVKENHRKARIFALDVIPILKSAIKEAASRGETELYFSYAKLGKGNTLLREKLYESDFIVVLEIELGSDFSIYGRDIDTKGVHTDPGEFLITW